MDTIDVWSGSAIDYGDIPARLERLPMTSYQRKLFAFIVTAWLADQVDVALLAFLLGSLVVAFLRLEDIHLSHRHFDDCSGKVVRGDL
jgi:hypothetical protein